MEERFMRSVGRPRKITGEEFGREYKKFRSGEYGKMSKREFAKLLGMGASTFASYEKKLKDSGGISRQERKELKTLADDFCLIHRKDVQDIIENCRSYAEGQQRIMKVYRAVYL